jgi:hypothetical protein
MSSAPSTLTWTAGENGTLAPDASRMDITPQTGSGTADTDYCAHGGPEFRTLMSALIEKRTPHARFGWHG